MNLVNSSAWCAFSNDGSVFGTRRAVNSYDFNKMLVQSFADKLPQIKNNTKGTFLSADGYGNVVATDKLYASSQIPLPRVVAKFEETDAETLIACGEGGSMRRVQFPSNSLEAQTKIDRAFVNLKPTRILDAAIANIPDASNYIEKPASNAPVGSMAIFSGKQRLESSENFKTFTSKSVYDSLNIVRKSAPEIPASIHVAEPNRLVYAPKPQTLDSGPMGSDGVGGYVNYKPVKPCLAFKSLTVPTILPTVSDLQPLSLPTDGVIVFKEGGFQGVQLAPSQLVEQTISNCVKKPETDAAGKYVTSDGSAVQVNLVPSSAVVEAINFANDKGRLVASGRISGVSDDGFAMISNISSVFEDSEAHKIIQKWLLRVNVSGSVADKLKAAWIKCFDRTYESFDATVVVNFCDILEKNLENFSIPMSVENVRDVRGSFVLLEYA